MYDTKIEVVCDLFSQRLEFKQNQLVVFELKPDDLFSLRIKHDFVKELNRITVPLSRESVEKVGLLTAFLKIAARYTCYPVRRENFGVRADFRMRSQKVNQHAATCPRRTSNHINVIAI